jgi:hypothetical protein
LEITKEFELSTISWSDHKYEEAADAAFKRIPLLRTHLQQINKDDRYRYELVKRMITVKAKKQTELEMKRRNRGVSTTHKSNAPKETVEVDSRSASEDPIPLSPKSSPIPTFSRFSSQQVFPRPYQPGRPAPILSPQSPQSTPADISDIFLAQMHRMSTPSAFLMIEYVSSFRNLQETLRRREGEIYGLQSKVIELERQLEGYRKADTQRNGVEPQRKASRR